MEAIEDIKMASVYFKGNNKPCDTFNLCDTKWVYDQIVTIFNTIQKYDLDWTISSIDRINSAVLHKTVRIETSKVQLSKMVAIDVSVARIGLANFATLIVTIKKARF